MVKCENPQKLSQYLLSFKKYLFDYDFDVAERNTLVIAPDDEFEKVVAQNLENHADVSSIHSAYFEIVQQQDLKLQTQLTFLQATAQSKLGLHYRSPTELVSGLGLPHALEQLDLI